MDQPLTSLGFVDSLLPRGTHICQIYTDDRERDEALLHFLLSGLEYQEKNACFSEKVSPATVESFMHRHSRDHRHDLESSALTLSRTSDIYFQDGIFVPERMLDLLKDFYQQALDQGFLGSRVIGEMSPAIQHIPGGSRLLEYEARVTLLVQEYPVTSVCQYHAHDFDEMILLDVLKVHPMMVVRGTVVNNPFFLPPEHFLS